jgi:hypothetical protein
MAPHAPARLARLLVETVAVPVVLGLRDLPAVEVEARHERLAASFALGALRQEHRQLVNVVDIAPQTVITRSDSPQKVVRPAEAGPPRDVSTNKLTRAWHGGAYTPLRSDCIGVVYAVRTLG